ncbi:hypothetical protein CF050_14565 [Clostridium botulinum]|uniref:hypothetical protein n=1 Tax=Clostridium botulinum TaxID=1491 RepID=UPI00196A1A10|nr:hypothetical protein [Clostridium botulinum]MBN3348068.1 hypothetical protein [Clostridium botulinum]
MYIQNSNYDANLLDLIFLTLSGPNIREQNIFIESEWLLVQFVFLYLLADVSFSSFFEKGPLILLRIGSRSKLWVVLIGKIILNILVFLFIQILTVVLLGIFFFPIRLSNNILATSRLLRLNINNLYAVFCMLLLLFLTYITLALIQNTMSIILKSPIISLLFCCILQFFTLNSGKINVNLMKWLPGNQSIVVRHTLINPDVVNFNISWSVFYNLFFIVVLIIIGFLYIDKLDII